MDAIEQLCRRLARLPGLGPRSAKRAALALLEDADQRLVPLIQALQQAQNEVKLCGCCGNLDERQPCRICSSSTRDATLLCIVERVADLWALERAGGFGGQYHVLGGTLSPVEGRGAEALRLNSLYRRVREQQIGEVVLATSMTVEGQVTAQYIVDLIAPLKVRVTRLAQGVPMGSDLDYLDEATLNAALDKRRNYE